MTAMCVFASPNTRIITYMGIIKVPTGTILVTRIRNAQICRPGILSLDSAYAHIEPRVKQIKVEETAIIMLFLKKWKISSFNALSKFSMVGVKIIVGGTVNV